VTVFAISNFDIFARFDLCIQNKQ